MQPCLEREENTAISHPLRTVAMVRQEAAASVARIFESNGKGYPGSLVSHAGRDGIAFGCLNPDQPLTGSRMKG